MPNSSYGESCTAAVGVDSCDHTITPPDMAFASPTASPHCHYSSIAMLVAVTLVFGYLYRVWSWRGHPFYHDPGSPRVVPYYVPFLGSTAAFWTDMLGFLQRHSKRYDSDIFAAYMGGRPFIFVLDPLAAQHLVSGRISSLSWVEAKYRMMKNGLGGSHEGAHTWITQADLKDEHAVVERHMMHGVSLNKTLKQYQIALEQDIVPNLLKQHNKNNDDNAWTKNKLLSVVGKAIYYATIETVFGYRSLKNEQDYDITMIFERKFPMFTGTNSQLMQKFDRKEYSAREQHIQKLKGIFQKLLSPDYQAPKDKESDFFGDLIKDYGQLAYKTMSLDDIARFHYLFFVASYFNTIPAGFWAIFQMLHEPKAYEACRKEVVAAKKAKEMQSKEEQGENGKYFTLQELDSMDMLESLIQESMRLRSTTKMIRLRYANEDFRLKLPMPCSGQTQEFDVKKGTYFVSCPTLMHQDPEIFQDPLTFQYDRFARDPNTGTPPQFFKKGKRLHRPVDAFGGGLSMCPGRRFAVTEIKALIAEILLNYELRWPGGIPPEPPVDHRGIVNTGMPTHDVEFEFRRL